MEQVPAPQVFWFRWICLVSGGMSFKHLLLTGRAQCVLCQQASVLRRGVSGVLSPRSLRSSEGGCNKHCARLGAKVRPQEQKQENPALPTSLLMLSPPFLPHPFPIMPQCWTRELQFVSCPEMKYKHGIKCSIISSSLVWHGKHWRVLGRGVRWSDLCFIKTTLPAFLRNDSRGAGAGGGTIERDLSRPGEGWRCEQAVVGDGPGIKEELGVMGGF